MASKKRGSSNNSINNLNKALIGLVVLVGVFLAVGSTENNEGSISGYVTLQSCADLSNVQVGSLGLGNNKYLCDDSTSVARKLECWGGDANPIIGQVKQGWKCERWGWYCSGRSASQGGFCCNGVIQQQACPAQTQPSSTQPAQTVTAQETTSVVTGTYVLGLNDMVKVGANSIVMSGPTTLRSGIEYVTIKVDGVARELPIGQEAVVIGGLSIKAVTREYETNKGLKSVTFTTSYTTTSTSQESTVQTSTVGEPVVYTLVSGRPLYIQGKLVSLINQVTTTGGQEYFTIDVSGISGQAHIGKEAVTINGLTLKAVGKESKPNFGVSAVISVASTQPAQQAVVPASLDEYTLAPGDIIKVDNKVTIRVEEGLVSASPNDRVRLYINNVYITVPVGSNYVITDLNLTVKDVVIVNKRLTNIIFKIQGRVEMLTPAPAAQQPPAGQAQQLAPNEHLLVPGESIKINNNVVLKLEEGLLETSPTRSVRMYVNNVYNYIPIGASSILAGINIEVKSVDITDRKLNSVILRIDGNVEKIVPAATDASQLPQNVYLLRPGQSYSIANRDISIGRQVGDYLVINVDGTSNNIPFDGQSVTLEYGGGLDISVLERNFEPNKGLISVKLMVKQNPTPGDIASITVKTVTLAPGQTREVGDLTLSLMPGYVSRFVFGQFKLVRHLRVNVDGRLLKLAEGDKEIVNGMSVKLEKAAYDDRRKIVVSAVLAVDTA